MISHVAHLPITEEAEHLPTSLLLTAMDLYHLPTTDDMEAWGSVS